MTMGTMPDDIKRRVENGGEMFRRRTEDKYRRRLECWQALQKAVTEIVPVDLHAYLDPLKEQPENHPDYHAWLRIGELAPIGLRLAWSHSNHRWGQLWWIGHGSHCGRFAILPYEGAPVVAWEYEDELDCAIAKAYEVGLHFRPPDESTVMDPERHGWFARLLRRWLPRRVDVGNGME